MNDVTLTGKFASALLALLLYCNVCGAGIIAVIEGKSAVSDEIQGYINLAVQQSTSVGLHSLDRLEVNDAVPSGSPSFTVCLASMNEKKDWIHHQCLKTEMSQGSTLQKELRSQVATMTKHNTVRFPITKKISATHVIISTNQTDEDMQDLYWAPLPLLFSGTDDITGVEFYSSNNHLKPDVITVTFSLTCAPHHFSIFCSAQCQPPNERYRCDEVIGELKCAENWRGRNCNQNVFVSHQEASQFIRHRSKRANSWHSFEEVSQGNIERECNEEVCNREEAREAFENDALTNDFWRAYTDPNQCIPNRCVSSNSLRCEDRLGDYTCHCKPGYRGKNCQNEIDICASQPCKNGGSCQRQSLTSFRCACPAGFRGQTCNENINECVDNNCGPQGTCRDGINNYTCDCNRGYTGPTCEVEIDECENNPCENDGNCTDFVGYYTCQCPEEFDGQNCQHRISPCTSDPCLNGATCNLNMADYTYNCSCTSEYIGTKCQHHTESACGSLPCANGATCIPSDNSTGVEFECFCPLGFEGETCNQRIPPCKLNDNLCPYNSTCVSHDEDYICVCPLGFVGDKCQYRGNDSASLQRLFCEENTCLNEARCLLIANQTSCICRTGFNGTRCENEVDHCSSSPCTNNGQCIAVPTGFYCDCPEGYNGKRCEDDIDECIERPTLCSNGTCNNMIGSFECFCPPFNTGRYCELPFDPCASVPCLNGGSCIHNETTGYTCQCLLGYEGNDCERINDPCTEFTNPCVNGANCSADNSDISQAICTCTRDFYGQNCSKPIDNCAVPSNITAILNGEEVPQMQERDDCGENGKCVSEVDEFTCACERGFVGRFCQTVYTIPTVNCTSEDCLCPTHLQNEAHFHRGNQSKVKCHYLHYDSGICEPVTCLNASCSKTSNDLKCTWPSTCFALFLKDGRQDSFNCPVIEIVLNTFKLNQDATVEYFCDKIRTIPSHRRVMNESLIHCSLLERNATNATVTVAVDSITSQRQSIILATDIFNDLEYFLPKENALTAAPADFDPIFHNIIAIRFSNFEGKAKATALEQSQDGFDLMYLVIIFLILLLIIIVIIIAVVIKRRRRKKELQVTYIVNPNAMINDDNLAIVTPSTSRPGTPPLKTQLVEDFVNPMFVEDKPACHALTSRPSVHSNAYVSVPYATVSALDLELAEARKSSKNKDSKTKNADQKAPKPQQYEEMSNLTLPFDAKFPPAEDEPYAFATDSSSEGSPIFSLKQSSPKSSKTNSTNQTNSYEEIADLKRSRIAGSNAYETIDLVLGTPTSSISEEGATEDVSAYKNVGDEREYNFATEIPSVGVPEPFQSRGSSRVEKDITDSETTKVEDNVPTESENNLKNDEQEEHYQVPSSIFPEKDELFFPNGTVETGEIYAAPRKANPTA